MHVVAPVSQECVIASVQPPQTRPGASLRARIERGDCLLVPGCHDALSARIAESAGAEALTVNSFAVEAALLGQPDLGLLTLSEMIDQARRIAAAVAVPVICDGETGFGGVHNVARLVRELHAAGLAGVQIEDQGHPKRRPGLEGRLLVELEEQLERLAAAHAARAGADFLLVARSDADVISFAELVERCNRYLDAGADVVMPVCLMVDGRPLAAFDSDGQMEIYARLARAIHGPVQAALVPPGYTARDMGEIGYSLVGLPGAALEAAVNALDGAYRSLLETGAETAYRTAHPPRIAAPAGVMQLLGMEDAVALERHCLGGG